MSLRLMLNKSLCGLTLQPLYDKKVIRIVGMIEILGRLNCPIISYVEALTAHHGVLVLDNSNGSTHFQIR